jgi:hypothetical protein
MSAALMSEALLTLATFPLKVQRPIVRGWIFVIGTLFFMICGAEAVGIPAMFLLGPGPGVAGALGGGALALWGMLRLRRNATAPFQPSPLRVEAAGLRLPRSYRSRREVWIPFEKLASLRVFGEGERRGVVIRAGWSLHGLLVFPARVFAEADAPERLLSETRKAIQAHDPELFWRLEQRPGVRLGPP